MRNWTVKTIIIIVTAHCQDAVNKFGFSFFAVTIWTAYGILLHIFPS